jgi:hypothetical protein
VGVQVGKEIPRDRRGIPPSQVSWWRGVAGKQMPNGWRRYELCQCWYVPRCLELFVVGDDEGICLIFLTAFHREWSVDAVGERFCI